MTLTDTRALITGADSGIGQATAELFAREGADVAITYHTDEAGIRETAARVEAAILILDRIIAGSPAEPALIAWARGSRFAGSGDRAAVLVEQLEQGTIGDAPTLERLVREDVLGAEHPAAELLDPDLLAEVRAA